MIKWIKKYWWDVLSWFLIALGLLLFFILKEINLYIGGILLIITGIKQLTDGIREKIPSSMFVGVSATYLGVIVFLIKPSLEMAIDAFVCLVLFASLLLLLIYSILEKKFPLITKVFGAVFLILGGIMTSLSIKPLILSITQTGFASGWIYSASIIFIILVNFIYFKLVKYMVALTFLKINNYFCLALSISFFALYSGYFYLTNVSQDYLRDFLLIISISFVTSFGVISAIKSLLDKKPNSS